VKAVWGALDPTVFGGVGAPSGGRRHGQTRCVALAVLYVLWCSAVQCSTVKMKDLKVLHQIARNHVVDSI
jgi:hypothetical protein